MSTTALTDDKEAMLNDPDHLWDKVHEDGNGLDWVLLYYSDTHGNLQVQASGAGGVNQLKDLLRDDLMQFGGFKVTIHLMSGERKLTQVKFISFSWFGKNLDASHRRKAVTLNSYTRSYFRGVAYHFDEHDGDLTFLSASKLGMVLSTAGLTGVTLDFENGDSSRKPVEASAIFKADLRSRSPSNARGKPTPVPSPAASPLGPTSPLTAGDVDAIGHKDDDGAEARSPATSHDASDVGAARPRVESIGDLPTSLDGEVFKNVTKYCETCHKVCLQCCGRCRITNYCNRDCQRQDWKKHKLVCAKLS